jgi:arylsulfatase A-like enzyme
MWAAPGSVDDEQVLDHSIRPREASTMSRICSAPRLSMIVLVAAVLTLGIGAANPLSASGRSRAGTPSSTTAAAADRAVAAAATPPHIFFYNLDDLRDAFPGAIDPLRFMPKTRAWMASGRRYTQMFVADPSCCPSRSSLMTGRYPHNNGVHNQQEGPMFDGPHSMACYLRTAGYATYLDGKFLTTWPKTTLPPCFDHSTVMWGGYSNVQVRIDGKARTSSGYSTTYLGNQGRQYISTALSGTKPFLLYETPQAPHWVDTTNPDGSAVKLAVPDTKYATANVGTCSGVPEADRSDKPAYVRTMNYTTAQGQAMCQSQLRAIMSADDEFAATMQLLSDRGVLDNTLVILSSDNGYMWGEHGRWEKFVPYEPSLRVPLFLRWPGHVVAGTDPTRIVSYLDLLPTMLEAAGFTLPATAPRLDGESLLQPTHRTMMYSEYYVDSANPNIPSWRMVRTPTAKYIQTYNAAGTVIAREYYNLASDPAENTTLLGDASTSNDPPASTLAAMTSRLNGFATCTGAACVQ